MWVCVCMNAHTKPCVRKGGGGVETADTLTNGIGRESQSATFNNCKQTQKAHTHTHTHTQNRKENGVPTVHPLTHRREVGDEGQHDDGHGSHEPFHGVVHCASFHSIHPKLQHHHSNSRQDQMGWKLTPALRASSQHGFAYNDFKSYCSKFFILGCQDLPLMTDLQPPPKTAL